MSGSLGLVSLLARLESGPWQGEGELGPTIFTHKDQGGPFLVVLTWH